VNEDSRGVRTFSQQCRCGPSRRRVRRPKRSLNAEERRLAGAVERRISGRCCAPCAMPTGRRSTKWCVAGARHSIRSPAGVVLATVDDGAYVDLEAVAVASDSVVRVVVVAASRQAWNRRRAGQCSPVPPRSSSANSPGQSGDAEHGQDGDERGWDTTTSLWMMKQQSNFRAQQSGWPTRCGSQRRQIGFIIWRLGQIVGRHLETPGHGHRAARAEQTYDGGAEVDGTARPRRPVDRRALQHRRRSPPRWR
jgi:hypothetical protein